MKLIDDDITQGEFATIVIAIILLAALFIYG